VHLKTSSFDEEIDVDEETIHRWRHASNVFYQAQKEIEKAISDYQIKQRELEHLRDCFAKPNPSRTDKGYVLFKLGWKQVDTSLWEKDGRSVRLHEAYAEAKAEIQAVPSQE
jgi:hypothetical protein